MQEADGAAACPGLVTILDSSLGALLRASTVAVVENLRGVTLLKLTSLIVSDP